jgi:hypothetical protein
MKLLKVGLELVVGHQYSVMSFALATAESCPLESLDCGSMFPGEVEASVGDFPVALYLGPSLLYALHDISCIAKDH